MGLRDAVRAWRAGDPTACADMCAATASGGMQTQALAVLHARALTRLRRSGEAVRVLDRAFRYDAEPAQARLLRAIAWTRGDRGADGVAYLVTEMHVERRRGRRLNVEAALALALAYYAKRDFPSARAALRRIPVTAGIIYARALECGGWIEKAEGDSDAACRLFEAALAALGTARVKDRLLEANLLVILGNLAVESLAIDEAAALEHRWFALSETSRVAPWARFWHAMNRSMVAEIEGRASDALIHARDAARVAPSAAFVLFAQCRRAEVLHAYGEMIGYTDLALEIHEAAGSLDRANLVDYEEINVLAVVAQTLALLGDSTRARAVLHSLDELEPEQAALLTDEPAKRAYLDATRALVDDVAGETLRALHGARKAYAAFRRMNQVRRALSIAIRIPTLTGDAAIREFLVESTLPLPSASWLRTRAGELSLPHGDPTLATLSRSERDVLRMLCAGHSTAEIAAARGRSVQTIQNTISRLLHAYNVRSRSALITECARRGFPPSPVMDGSRTN